MASGKAAFPLTSGGWAACGCSCGYGEGWGLQPLCRGSVRPDG